MYKEMYLTMARAVEKAFTHLMMKEVYEALTLLADAKQKCEEMYISEENPRPQAEAEK